MNRDEKYFTKSVKSEHTTSPEQARAFRIVLCIQQFILALFNVHAVFLPNSKELA